MTLYQLFLEDSLDFIKEKYIPNSYWYEGLSSGFDRKGNADCFYFKTDKVESLSEDEDPFELYPYYYVRWENGIPVECKDYEGVFVTDHHIDLDELQNYLLDKLNIDIFDVQREALNLLDKFVANVSYDGLLAVYAGMYLDEFRFWDYNDDEYKVKDLDAQGLVDRAYELVSKNKNYQNGLKVFEKNYAKESSYFINESINLNESTKPIAYQKFFGGDSWYYGYPEAEEDARKEAKRLYGDNGVQEVWEDEYGNEIEGNLDDYGLVYASERRNESINLNDSITDTNIDLASYIRRDLMDYFSENYGYVKMSLGYDTDINFDFDVFNNKDDFRVYTEIIEDGYIDDSKYLHIAVISFKGIKEDTILDEIYDILTELNYDVECNKYECKVYLEKH